MIVIFAFFAFLFYRIMTAAMFDDPMSIIACLLAAVVNTAMLFFGTAVAAGWAADGTDPDGIGFNLWKALLGLASVVGVSFGAAWLISLGFSEEFYREISRSGYYRQEFYEQNWFWFFIVIAIPSIVHYGLIMNSLRRMK